jgi:hypothetical protein
MFNIFKKINNFFISFFEILSFRKTPILNNDIESCCLLNDDTNTLSE